MIKIGVFHAIKVLEIITVAFSVKVKEFYSITISTPKQIDEMTVLNRILITKKNGTF